MYFEEKQGSFQVNLGSKRRIQVILLDFFHGTHPLYFSGETGVISGQSRVKTANPGYSSRFFSRNPPPVLFSSRNPRLPPKRPHRKMEGDLDPRSRLLLQTEAPKSEKFGCDLQISHAQKRQVQHDHECERYHKQCQKCKNDENERKSRGHWCGGAHLRQLESVVFGRWVG